ATESSTAEDAH
uniref:KIAA1522 ortholog n=2 Tax=Nannospalax galili TaxID=1026970 RepID=A0A8C6S273_NANGA